jgi:hypothetical protein
MADKVRLFVEKLAQKTEEGKVSWERTADEGMFQAAFPNYTVQVFSRVNRDETVDYVVQIRDEDGVVIEEATEEVLKVGKYDRDTLELLAKMFRNARRKALGVDKAVDSILSVLTEGEPKQIDDDVQF